ncbi:uncharacterized protein LOC135291027 isoform X2 [Passer domesticus]|uniref:uncharacterized protein LOC135291027 isoform X2 n=1 Tax=Passer domesticus TaxID=48849 RepID=UPI0030FE8D0D
MASQNHLVLLSLHVPVEKKQEQMALSEMPCQAQGELFPARDQEEQLRKRVEEPQQNGQNIKSEPQAELPEAQSAIMAVERRKKEDMRRIQEEIHLHQHRGDQQKQVQVSTSHLAACKDFQQTMGNEGPQGWYEAQELSPPEVRQVQHTMASGVKPAAAAALPGGIYSVKPGNSSWGCLFITSSDSGMAAPKPETEKGYLEMLGRMVTMENPAMKYMEQEHISSGSFGDVVRALNNTTGGEHNVYCKLKQDEQSKNNVMRLWEHPC